MGGTALTVVAFLVTMLIQFSLDFKVMTNGKTIRLSRRVSDVLRRASQ
jgi:hypothetical protein